MVMLWSRRMRYYRCKASRCTRWNTLQPWMIIMTFSALFRACQFSWPVVSATNDELLQEELTTSPTPAVWDLVAPSSLPSAVGIIGIYVSNDQSNGNSGGTMSVVAFSSVLLFGAVLYCLASYQQRRHQSVQKSKSEWYLEDTLMTKGIINMYSMKENIESTLTNGEGIPYLQYLQGTSMDNTESDHELNEFDNDDIESQLYVQHEEETLTSFYSHSNSELAFIQDLTSRRKIYDSDDYDSDEYDTSKIYDVLLHDDFDDIWNQDDESDHDVEDDSESQEYTGPIDIDTGVCDGNDSDEDDSTTNICNVVLQSDNFDDIWNQDEESDPVNADTDIELQFSTGPIDIHCDCEDRDDNDHDEDDTSNIYALPNHSDKFSNQDKVSEYVHFDSEPQVSTGIGPIDIDTGNCVDNEDDELNTPNTCDVLQQDHFDDLWNQDEVHDVGNVDKRPKECTSPLNIDSKDSGDDNDRDAHCDVSNICDLLQPDQFDDARNPDKVPDVAIDESESHECSGLIDIIDSSGDIDDHDRDEYDTSNTCHVELQHADLDSVWNQNETSDHVNIIDSKSQACTGPIDVVDSGDPGNNDRDENDTSNICDVLQVNTNDDVRNHNEESNSITVDYEHHGYIGPIDIDSGEKVPLVLLSAMISNERRNHSSLQQSQSRRIRIKKRYHRRRPNYYGTSTTTVLRKKRHKTIQMIRDDYSHAKHNFDRFQALLPPIPESSEIVVSNNPIGCHYCTTGSTVVLPEDSCTCDATTTTTTFVVQCCSYPQIV